MESQTVAMTGASGFLGSHILEHLLNAGYAVKALCRGWKASELRSRTDDPKLMVTAFDDLTNDDFSSVLQGVYAVVHVASPTPFYTDHVQVAVKGTLNILTQAYAAGVRKFVVISSIYSIFGDHNELLDPSRVFDHNSWGTTPQSLRQESAKILKEFLSRETISDISLSTEKETPLDEFSDINKPVTEVEDPEGRKIDRDPESVKTLDPFEAYAGSKLLAEEAMWAFADAHQDIDIISILPAYFYGPFSKFHVIREPTTLSTNYILYSIFARPQPSYPPAFIPEQVVDVRDVAKACVLAMSTNKSTSTTPRRRILLSSGSLSWEDVSAEIARVYPGIKNRVIDEPLKRRGAARLDVSMASQILGLDEFIPWRTTVKDAVECLLQTEDKWNA